MVVWNHGSRSPRNDSSETEELEPKSGWKSVDFTADWQQQQVISLIKTEQERNGVNLLPKY